MSHHHNVHHINKHITINQMPNSVNPPFIKNQKMIENNYNL